MTAMPRMARNNDLKYVLIKYTIEDVQKKEEERKRKPFHLCPTIINVHYLFYKRSLYIPFHFLSGTFRSVLVLVTLV